MSFVYADVIVTKITFYLNTFPFHSLKRLAIIRLVVHEFIQSYNQDFAGGLCSSVSIVKFTLCKLVRIKATLLRDFVLCNRPA